jgi:ParB-like chromosome segregation protein Spo0J
MKIELWSIDKPIPYARNARTIPQAAVDKVAASIREFGWQQPIVVDVERIVVAGHVRLLAAKQLGEKKVPVLVATGLTPAQTKAFRLMDNRSHQETGWDMELLGLEISELQTLSADVALMSGFNAEEIAEFLASAGGSSTDAPNDFKTYDESIPVAHECPKCGYTWSGAASPKATDASEAEVPPVAGEETA